ncbi:NAD+ synthase [Candidatus Woesearchaeota archaeon]|nr:NAD+ synthase [Candidatus Woesearchaeota archaeon]
MLTHKIALAQVNPTVGDLIGNGRKIIEYIGKAKTLGAQLVVFPEQVVIGYPAQDLLLHHDFVQDVMGVNQAIASHAEGITAIVGSVEAVSRGPDGNALANVALVMQNGKIVTRRAKTHLPNYDVFYEKRYFTPATTVSPIIINGVRYGLSLCEDIWDDNYSRKVLQELMQQGAEVLINLSASPYYIGKKAVRYGLMQRHARDCRVPQLYCNMVGGQDELIFDGGSMLLDENGALVTQLPQFKEQILLATNNSQPLETMLREEETFAALTLGVHDYMHKNGLQKAVLGLSGGIDSAVTAVIAAAALGPTNVKGLALPSQFNPPQALRDAQQLADWLGIDFDVVPIGGMYESAMKELTAKFEGKPFDVTEENIQARLRMMVLMAYVNKHGYALLSTSDKSETALGYTTLYGDMSGGLSVISDLTKPEVYALAAWYNQRYGPIIPLSTLTKPPSPELKPGQVTPFDYSRLSPLLEGLTERTPISALLEKGYSHDEVNRMYRRWRGAEFKRWQAPIALKCKPISFGRGRLYPVTNRYVPSSL